MFGGGYDLIAFGSQTTDTKAFWVGVMVLSAFCTQTQERFVGVKDPNMGLCLERRKGAVEKLETQKVAMIFDRRKGAVLKS